MIWISSPSDTPHWVQFGGAWGEELTVGHSKSKTLRGYCLGPEENVYFPPVGWEGNILNSFEQTH